MEDFVSGAAVLLDGGLSEGGVAGPALLLLLIVSEKSDAKSGVEGILEILEEYVRLDKLESAVYPVRMDELEVLLRKL